MQGPRVYIGIGPPNVLPVPLISPGPTAFGIDLTTVTAVRFRVFDPTDNEITPSPAWSGGSIAAGATATAATALYPFVGNEFNQEGTWEVVPVLTVPGGSTQCSRVPIEVCRKP